MFFHEVSSIVQQIFGTASKSIMCEDYLRAARQREGIERMFSHREFDLCFSAIRSNILFPFNADVPEPLREVSPLPTRFLSRETNYDHSACAQEVNQQVPTLNNEQRLACDEISQNINREEGGVIFLDKKDIPHESTIGESEIDRTIAVVSSGIATTFLAGGTAAH